MAWTAGRPPELSRMVLGGAVEPGDKVIVDVSDDDLDFQIESGGAHELVEAGDRAEEPAAARA